MKFSREEKTPWGRRSCSKQTSWKGTTIQNSCRQIFPGVRERSQAAHYLTGSWFYYPFSKFSTEMWKTLIKLFYLPDFDWVLIQASPLRQLASTWWDVFLECFLLNGFCSAEIWRILCISQSELVLLFLLLIVYFSRKRVKKWETFLTSLLLSSYNTVVNSIKIKIMKH